MGFFTKNIAKESKTPEIVSLSNNPNYIQFESLNKTSENKHIELMLKVLNTTLDLDKTKMVIVESKTDTKHELIGTRNRNEVNNTTYFVHDDKAITAENIRACLMADSFFRSNFYMTVPVINNISSLDNGNVIKLQSIGTGDNYAFIINTDNSFIEITGNPTQTSNNDTINGGSEDCEIDIEIYRDTNLFLGTDDTPQNNVSIGTYTTKLTKAYYNNPIWFNINSFMSNSKVFSNDFLTSEGWRNTGTVTDFRFVTRKFDGVNREPFYVSNALYAVTGYSRNLEANDLSEYVYNTKIDNVVKPLTKQPMLNHIKGQTQYFNFILSDPDRTKNLGAEEYNLGIIYKLYSQSRKLIRRVIAHEQNRKLFNIANTIRLDIDRVIGSDSVGYVEVCLCRSGVEISYPLKFVVLPDCLYRVNDFAFLNSLGGWSSFNFSGTATTEFKTTSNVITKTQTPKHTISSDIESVYSKEVDEKFTAQTMPINNTVADWLKELSSSIAVYELATKRYVIVDELNIKPNSKDQLFKLELKYHYSDSYNAHIQ